MKFRSPVERSEANREYDTTLLHRADRVWIWAKYAKGLACRSMNRKLPEACEIHSDERKKCTEVQEFSCMLISAANVVQKHCTPKRQNTDEQDVIRGRAAARL